MTALTDEQKAKNAQEMKAVLLETTTCNFSFKPCNQCEHLSGCKAMQDTLWACDTLAAHGFGRL